MSPKKTAAMKATERIRERLQQALEFNSIDELTSYYITNMQDLDKQKRPDIRFVGRLVSFNAEFSQYRLKLFDDGDETEEAFTEFLQEFQKLDLLEQNSEIFNITVFGNISDETKNLAPGTRLRMTHIQNINIFRDDQLQGSIRNSSNITVLPNI